ncbi:hypothetical protein CI238_09428 [Colletotrichum incanum]|uniref:Uncharacterized protein n=1 Tax=Colletotrichum incanum TaxID=1573173 RepID=A0A167C6T4_COLIC|nr:hypothetical protein CI238_09428 [Colletotrichum incanum]OHW98982.1 hypothetical protein CSPAE12_02371 [Colletotrichum incanum]
MHFSIIFSLFAVTATLTAAAPSHDAKRDDTVCAPGTGFFQSCANGFRGCCKSDACTLGYCPSVSEKRQDPTVCAPGTGFFQSCSNGFRGCCKSDACTIGYCPGMSGTSDNKPAETTPATNVHSAHWQPTDPTVCAPGTGFFQSCSNGFRGCCKSDACTIGYCPTVETETVKRQDPTVCAPGTGFFQSCSNGFRGCCKQDACTIGYCPDVKAAIAEKRTTDPTVCPPNTGFFQSCANGFRGCCKSDACAIGYCPDVKVFETVTKAAPKTTPTPTPEAQSNNNGNGNADPTVCAPGTGFFQSCSNGFRGCCKQDACSIGFCPSN